MLKEWASGKIYYNADVTFHPHTFPCRANPTRISDFLHQYDDYAPHVVVPAGVEDDAPPAAEIVRATSRAVASHWSRYRT